MNWRRTGHLLRATAGLIGRATKVAVPPVHFQIEASSRCNFRCSYCVRGAAADAAVPDHGMIRSTDLQAVLEKIRRDAPAASVSLSVGGEPLLHDGILELIALCNRFGYAAGFSTNGSRLSEALARDLVRSDLRYGLLVDFTADRALYEEARAGGSWEQVLRNLRRYLEICTEAGRPSALSLKEMGGVSAPASERARRLRALQALFPTLPPERFSSLHRHNWTGEAGTARRGHYRTCSHPWLAMAVNVRGDVLACCRDLREQYVVGSLLGPQGLLEVWNAPRMQSLRRALIERRPDEIAPCRGCDRPYRAGEPLNLSLRRQGQLVWRFLRRK